MFGIGFSELIILSIIILVLVGPEQLPEVLKTISKVTREFMKARDDFGRTVNEDDDLRSIKDSVNEVKGSIQDRVDEFKLTLHKKTQQVESELQEVSHEVVSEPTESLTEAVDTKISSSKESEDKKS